jgi:hypothetical protein
VVELVNLDAEDEHRVIVQAGAFAEHAIEDVRYTACEDGSWLGDLYDYGHGDPAVIERHADVRGPWLTVRLPASTRVRLPLRLAMYACKPSYASPFAPLGPADRQPRAAAVEPAGQLLAVAGTGPGHVGEVKQRGVRRDEDGAEEHVLDQERVLAVDQSVVVPVFAQLLTSHRNRS